MQKKFGFLFLWANCCDIRHYPAKPMELKFRPKPNHHIGAKTFCEKMRILLLQPIY